jgi:capsular polysaccharide transport system ATP-binding protein
MIVVEDVHKRYMTRRGMGDWVLRGVNLSIPARRSVGLIGANGAGKSTLLRIIGGADYPNKGRVERQCRVSWPMSNGGLEGTLSGRQNAKFICRIHGHQDDIPERLERIQEFADLGAAFEDPVQTYSSGMRSRLQFALSLAFNFEVYISDEVTSAGDAAFRKKAADAFRNLAGRSSIIMAAHDDGTLKTFCQSGILLAGGRAQWFDEIDDALRAYKDSIQR